MDTSLVRVPTPLIDNEEVVDEEGTRTPPRIDNLELEKEKEMQKTSMELNAQELYQQYKSEPGRNKKRFDQLWEFVEKVNSDHKRRWDQGMAATGDEAIVSLHVDREAEEENPKFEAVGELTAGSRAFFKIKTLENSRKLLFKLHTVRGQADMYISKTVQRPSKEVNTWKTPPRTHVSEKTLAVVSRNGFPEKTVFYIGITATQPTSYELEITSYTFQDDADIVQGQRQQEHSRTAARENVRRRLLHLRNDKAAYYAFMRSVNDIIKKRANVRASTVQEATVVQKNKKKAFTLTEQHKINYQKLLVSTQKKRAAAARARKKDLLRREVRDARKRERMRQQRLRQATLAAEELKVKETGDKKDGHADVPTLPPIGLSIQVDGGLPGAAPPEAAASGGNGQKSSLVVPGSVSGGSSRASTRASSRVPSRSVSKKALDVPSLDLSSVGDEDVLEPMTPEEQSRRGSLVFDASILYMAPGQARTRDQIESWRDSQERCISLSARALRVRETNKDITVAEMENEKRETAQTHEVHGVAWRDNLSRLADSGKWLGSRDFIVPISASKRIMNHVDVNEGFHDFYNPQTLDLRTNEVFVSRFKQRPTPPTPKAQTARVRPTRPRATRKQRKKAKTKVTLTGSASIANLHGSVTSPDVINAVKEAKEMAIDAKSMIRTGSVPLIKVPHPVLVHASILRDIGNGTAPGWEDVLDEAGVATADLPSHALTRYGLLISMANSFITELTRVMHYGAANAMEQGTVDDPEVFADLCALAAQRTQVREYIACIEFLHAQYDAKLKKISAQEDIKLERQRRAAEQSLIARPPSTARAAVQTTAERKKRHVRLAEKTQQYRLMVQEMEAERKREADQRIRVQSKKWQKKKIVSQDFRNHNIFD